MGLKDLAAKARDAAKGALFEEEEASASTVTATPTNASVVTPVISVVSAYVDVDPEIKARIEGVARGANQQSYTEFSGYLSALAEAGISDEGQRYRGALATATKKGFPEEEVIRGLDTVLAALIAHEEQFNRSVPQRISEKVGAREQEVAAIDRTIKDMQDTILRLQQELQALDSERKVKFAAIRGEREQIETTAKKFTVALTAVKQGYAQEREKILQYGKKGA